MRGVEGGCLCYNTCISIIVTWFSMESVFKYKLWIKINLFMKYIYFLLFFFFTSYWYVCATWQRVISSRNAQTCMECHSQLCPKLSAASCSAIWIMWNFQRPTRKSYTSNLSFLNWLNSQELSGLLMAPWFQFWHRTWTSSPMCVEKDIMP